MPARREGDDPDRVVEVALAGPGDLDDARFTGLFEALARVDHPGLPRLHDVRIEGRLRVTVMERVDGWPLRSLLGRRELVLDAVRLGSLGHEVADTLRALHDAGRPFGVAHGRLGLTHVVVERSGRLRVCGFPLPTHLAGVLPDAMGVGGIVAAAAVGMAPDPRGTTPAWLRGLAHTLERPETAVRLPAGLRSLLCGLLALHPEGFMPAMSVLSANFAAIAGRRAPSFAVACGSSLHHATVGLVPGHRPTAHDAQHVVEALASQVTALAPYAAGSPPTESGAASAPRLRLSAG